MIKCYEISQYISKLKQLFNDGCTKLQPKDMMVIMDVIDAVRRCSGDSSGGSDLPDDIVLYTPQQKEEFEKEIARLNIDAISTDDVKDLIERYLPEVLSLFGFEAQSNKQNNLNTDGSGEKYPTVDAVNTAILQVRQEISNTTSDKNFVYEQIFPSEIWDFGHPLDKKPSPIFVDSAGTEILGKVTINDGKRMKIEFNAPVNGFAILN